MKEETIQELINIANILLAGFLEGGAETKYPYLVERARDGIEKAEEELKGMKELRNSVVQVDPERMKTSIKKMRFNIIDK